MQSTLSAWHGLRVVTEHQDCPACLTIRLLERLPLGHVQVALSRWTIPQRARLEAVELRLRRVRQSAELHRDCLSTLPRGDLRPGVHTCYHRAAG